MRFCHVLFTMLGVAVLPMTAQDNVFPATGNVGIGTNSPTSKLEVIKSATNEQTRATIPAVSITNTQNADVTGYYRWQALKVMAFGRPIGGVKNNGENTGLAVESVLDTPGSLGFLHGINILSGTRSGGGSVNRAYGLRIQSVRQGGTTDYAYGIYLDEPTGSGTVTNDWAIYSKNPAQSYLRGPLSLGGGNYTGSQLAIWRRRENDKGYGFHMEYLPSATVDGNYGWQGIDCNANVTVAAGVRNSGYARGASFDIKNIGPGDLRGLHGVSISAGNNRTASGRLDSLACLTLTPLHDGGTIDLSYALVIANPGSTATVGRQYAIYSKHTAPSYFAGNIGIGTANPAAMFEAATNEQGNGAILGSSFAGVWKQDRAYAAFSHKSFQSAKADTSYALIQDWNGTTKVNAGPARDLSLCIGGQAQVTVKSTGSVGIGTDAPGTYKLAVNGSIRAKEVVVETGWGDHVFNPDYKLPSLDEVEEHIRKHGRLPGVQSAKEIQKNGVGVADMLTRQQIKIEELTLYVIELKKQNEALQKRLEALEEKAK